jgi:hypothetical protein
MTDDFGAFKANDTDGPPDGEHTAWLEHAVLRDTRNGKAIKCEWRTTDMTYWWESWHNTSGGGKQRTQQMLAEMGIELGKLNGWEQLEDELAARESGTYIVKVSHSPDGRFTNTAVLERPQGVQTDLPIDTRKLPQPAPAASTAGNDLFNDDDVPF